MGRADSHLVGQLRKVRIGSGSMGRVDFLGWISVEAEFSVAGGLDILLVG